MKIDEAMNIITQAARSVNTNAEGHDLIAQALNTISAELKKVPKTQATSKRASTRKK